MMDLLQHVGVWGGWLVVWLLCAAGLILSCLSISGTWLVTGAAALAVLLAAGGFPTWWLVGIYGGVSVVVELMEWGAGSWGVTNRGGSGWAGAAAVVGGIIGMIAGGVLPPPVLGSLIGMMAGSFLGAFLVELRRLKHTGQAAGIAWGAVVARVLVILIKVIATLAMIATLAVGLLRAGP